MFYCFKKDKLGILNTKMAFNNANRNKYTLMYGIAGIVVFLIFFIVMHQVNSLHYETKILVNDVNDIQNSLHAYRDAIISLSRQIELNRVEYPLLWNVEQYACKNKLTMGNIWHDHTICLDFGKPTKDMVMYSFGIGTDCSFDLEMIQKYGINVYAFDPSPASIDYIESQSHGFPKQFRFYPWGIWNFDGTIEMQVKDASQHSVVRIDGSAPYDSFPVYTLETIMKKLGHTKIDILKIDVEGSEWVVFEKILRAAYTQDGMDLFDSYGITHILTEFHHPNYDLKYGQGKSAPDVNIIIQKLNALGFYTFDIGTLRENFQYRDMAFVRIKDPRLVKLTNGVHIYDYM